jgi:hypothetical protein
VVVVALLVDLHKLGHDRVVDENAGHGQDLFLGQNVWIRRGTAFHDVVHVFEEVGDESVAIGLLVSGNEVAESGWRSSGRVAGKLEGVCEVRSENPPAVEGCALSEGERGLLGTAAGMDGTRHGDGGTLMGV